MEQALNFDVVIVGAGPAGLSTAIRLAQLAKLYARPLEICILEKGSEVGSHILSGAVFDPRALTELIPDWLKLGAPLETKVTTDALFFLTKNNSYPLPLPPSLKNGGNYIISMGRLCQWLGREAEKLGVTIFSGFAATSLMTNEAGRTLGVMTDSKGLDKTGQPLANYQAAMQLFASYVVLAEGVRGSLTQQVIKDFKLQGKYPQTYALGIKEIWQIPKENHQAGQVFHTLGFPMEAQNYGGAFLYHYGEQKISLGLTVGLDYKNPSLDPFQELQRLKLHPFIKKQLLGGRRLSYGAKSLNEGGLQSLPQLVFKGGLIVGCAAGFLNVARLKGNHTAMKSGMLAAEALFSALINGCPELVAPYEKTLKQSWLWQELYTARNVRPSFKWGLWAGLIYSAVDQYLLKGKAPWTFGHQADHLSLKKQSRCKKIIYPKPDGILTFDKLSSVQLSHTHHRENQPCHLQLKDPMQAIEFNWKKYGSPEQYYCPANVYEILELNHEAPRLQINAANCLHCKTCDIKDPGQNIKWQPPEGGGGPHYSNM